MATASILPVETIEFEILPRLPVKSLLRFKSVCKTWNLLISSNIFIKSLRKQNHDTLTLMMKGNHVWIIGCINGLVCLYDSHKNFGDIGFVIWNPATKQCLKIAPPSNRSPPKRGLLQPVNNEVLGFGFDSVANDYKIMIVSAAKEQPLVGCMYSCNARCWSQISPSDFLFRGFIREYWEPVIVDGYPFWLNIQNYNLNGNTHLAVISFDVQQGFCRLLPGFSSIYNENKREFEIYNMLNFRNSVAVMNYYVLYSVETIDIYIFNERCCDWSKMSIGPFKSTVCVPIFNFLHCFSNGDILFVRDDLLYSERKELYRANILNHTIKSLGKVRDSIVYGCTYSESLVFVDGMKPFCEIEDQIRLFYLKNGCKSIYKRENTRKKFRKKKHRKKK